MEENINKPNLLLRCCADKYVNTCVQVFEADQTTEIKTGTTFTVRPMKILHFINILCSMTWQI